MIDLKTLPTRYQRYYTYLEPVIADPLVRGYFGLIASFLLVAFFVIFALSPTINTILALNKKIADQKTTIVALDTKINDLVTASQNYSQIESLLPFLDGALPEKSSPQTAITTITQTATASAVSVSALQFQPIVIFGSQEPAIPEAAKRSDLVPEKLFVLPFSLSAGGPRDAILNYLEKLENSWRYLRFVSLGVATSKDNTVIIDGSGIAYYYPKVNEK